MRRFLGHLAFIAALGALILGTGTPVARAAPVYEITVTITDLTNAAHDTSFMIMKGDPNDTNPSPGSITANGSFLTASTAATGLTFTGLGADTSSTSTATSLTSRATFVLSFGVGGAISTDHYIVKIETTHDTFTLPPPSGMATLSTSTSGSYTFTTAGNTQSSDSYYSPTNTANDTTGPHAGPAFISGGIPVAGGSNASGASPTLSTMVTPYVVPYALTNILTIDITGNAANPTTVQPTGVTTLSSVPEPASMVVFLTGIPLPIVLVGLLRRRRAVV
jgi:hypothetical protein